MFLVATNHLCQVSSNFETLCQISKNDPMYHNDWNTTETIECIFSGYKIIFC